MTLKNEVSERTAMKRISRLVARAALLAGAIALTPAVTPAGTPIVGAMAQETDPSPEALAAEGLDKLVSAISLFLKSIPQYEAPEILPNGDIIIRRVQPEDEGGGDDAEDGTGPSDQGDNSI